MTSVQAAAARLVKYHDDYDHVYWDGNKAPFDPDEDGVTVARAFLEHVREDDGEAIDEPWLKSVSGPRDEVLSIAAFQIPARGMYCGSLEFRKSGQVHLAGIVMDNPPNTRGDLRLLCRALGVPLAESPSAAQRQE